MGLHAISGGFAGTFDAYAYLRDEKTAGTNGGASTSGSWETRVLNTEVVDADGIVSLASNQFTLQAGSYWIVARAPNYGGGRHKLRLRNITDGSDVLIGASCYSLDSPSKQASHAYLCGRISIAGAKAFELQHRCESSDATFGMGVGSNFGVAEVYAEVEIWRES